ncbi:hypothetical protein J2X17_000937 [Flavobacterium aquidurense]|nr:hypothetical protein [Flavobacterium aquidurense]
MRIKLPITLTIYPKNLISTPKHLTEIWTELYSP